MAWRINIGSERQRGGISKYCAALSAGENNGGEIAAALNIVSYRAGMAAASAAAVMAIWCKQRKWHSVAYRAVRD